MWPRILVAALLTVAAAAAVVVPVAVGEENGGGPDESPAQAQPLAPDTAVAGAFQGSTDYFDYYSFQAQAGQTLTFTLTDTTSSCSGTNDPYQDGCPVYGWLTDASNQQLGGPNSAAGGNTSVGRNGAYLQQTSWSWTFSQTGTYYIALTDDQGPAIPAGTPSYTIEWSGASTSTTTTTTTSTTPTTTTTTTTTTASSTTAHHRTISLSVKRGTSALTFQGQLGENNGFRPCTGYQPVQIQRQSGTSWLTVAHTMTGTAQPQGPAAYSVRGSEKAGIYRAVAPQTTAGSTDTCGRAVSKSVAVSPARHRRRAVLQSVPQGGNHAYLVGYVKATDRFDSCAQHVPVIAQRRAGARWIKVGSGRTGSPNPQGRATFNIRAPLRSGTYRALVPRDSADALDSCLKAISNTKPGPPGVH
jgi:hypothetical protein